MPLFSRVKGRIKSWAEARAERMRERREHEKERKERLRKLYEETYERELTRVHAQEAVKVAQERARARALREARGGKVDWPKWRRRLQKVERYRRTAAERMGKGQRFLLGREQPRPMKSIDEHMRDLIGGGRRRQLPHIETATQDLLDFQNPYLRKRERR